MKKVASLRLEQRKAISPLKSYTKRSLSSQLIGLGVVILFGLAALWVASNRQTLLDYIVAWQYQPTSEVSNIVKRTDMSDGGKLVFYASQPSVDDAADFNKNCKSVEQNSATLGCFTGDRIYIYNVTDARLDGIRETTAAHEMLHAAYQRLDTAERQRVNKLLELEYDKLKNDKDFSARMALYARTEPGERDNELHSIIGTEVSAINPELETYYKKYFANRQVIVKLHDAYNSTFTDLSTKKDALVSQLMALDAKLNTETKQYNDDVAQLYVDRDTFNARANDNGFSSRAEYNNQLAALMQRIDALGVTHDVIMSDIATYKALYAEYQSIAGQSDTLNRSINSKLAPAPSL